jgi:hypothetical protein
MSSSAQSGLAMIALAAVIAWLWWSGTGATILAALTGRLQEASA